MKEVEIGKLFKRKFNRRWAWSLVLVIPATQEVEIREITI
jgi:hypothetical protein